MNNKAQNQWFNSDSLIIDKDTPSIKKVGEYLCPTPEVTIFIPTFNRPLLLRETIVSVLNQQNFGYYQLLIVDNAGYCETVTETEQVIRSFCDKRIIYFQNETTIVTNWTRCIQLAKTKWVCMLHDDDVLLPGHLATMAQIIRTRPDADYVTARYENFFDPDLPPARPAPKEVDVFRIHWYALQYEFLYPILGAFFRKDLSIKMGCFIPGGTGCADYCLAARFVNECHAYCVDHTLYGYRRSAVGSVARPETGQKVAISHYLLLRALSRRYHTILRPYCEILARRTILMFLDAYKYYPYNVEELEQECGVSIEYIRKNFWSRVVGRTYKMWMQCHKRPGLFHVKIEPPQ